ncbi:MAG TPA: aspartate aminotransferase, partial [Syntrophobacteraceae bacterium]|nr:aspartate aminotransferase [Syntrophobacteraceae bacterium]
PLHIQAAAIEAIRDGHTRYTAVSGINELKDAIVDTVQKDYGLTYRRDNVLVSCGGKHALYNLFQTLLDPDDEVIIPAPFWVSYPDMVELTGAKSVEVPTREIDGFKLRPEQLEKVLTPKTRMLILNSPSNPTGAHYRRDELDALAETILRHNLTVLSDDIYYRILFDGQEWVNMAMLGERLKERTFIANGVSKSYCMTGWRIGYLVGDAAVLSAASKIQSQSTSNPCSIAQWASVAALNGPQEDVEKMVQIFQERCSYVLKRLAEIPGVTCYKPNGAFYVFPNFSCTFGKSVDGRVIKGSLDLADYLMEKANVAVVPGSAFGEDSCLRFSYAISMEELTEGFDRISRAIAALK